MVYCIVIPAILDIPTLVKQEYTVTEGIVESWNYSLQIKKSILKLKKVKKLYRLKNLGIKIKATTTSAGLKVKVLN